MKRLLIYMIMQTAIYVFICATAWTWILGHEVNLLKVIAVGILQSVLLVVCHAVTQTIKEKEEHK